MEKLQAALEQARSRRSDGPSGTLQNRGARTSNKRQSNVLVDQRWEELESFPLDERKLLKNRVFFGNSKKSEVSSFDVLRTKVLLQMDKSGWRRLAVTSAASGAGKSTVCGNLASSIARQSSIRAILMDLDMRRPSLARIMGVLPEGTVSDVLTGDTRFEDQAKKIGPNVALSLNSRPAKDPSDVFLKGTTAERIDQIEAAYKPDIMIFDVPPLFVNDDATAFFTNVDCVLIVIDAERTTTAELDRCENEIAEHTNVLGMVLNKCRFPEEGYTYGYGYGYGETY